MFVRYWQHLKKDTKEASHIIFYTGYFGMFPVFKQSSSRTNCQNQKSFQIGCIKWLWLNGVVFEVIFYHYQYGVFWNIGVFFWRLGDFNTSQWACHLVGVKTKVGKNKVDQCLSLIFLRQVSFESRTTLVIVYYYYRLRVGCLDTTSSLGVWYGKLGVRSDAMAPLCRPVPCTVGRLRVQRSR